MRFIHLWRFLPVISWFAVVGAGVWGYFTLSDLGDFTTNGTPRTVVDKAVPYAFLLLAPFGLWMARREFVRARDEIPLADANAEKKRLQRQRQKEAQERLANRPPISDEIKEAALASVDLLKSAGVIGQTEIDEDAFLETCQAHDLEDGDLYDATIILALHAETHGDFANALFVPDQVEVTEADAKNVIHGFARLAGQDITDLKVTFPNPRKRGSDGEARFSLAGTPQTITFEHHNKNASGSLMDGLVATLKPTRPYAAAYFDSVFLVTCLSEQERTNFNAALDPEYETFTRFSI